MTGAVLQCEDVQKVFGSLVAVGGASLHVDAGEVLGLVGPNGSGKSTLINLLSGYLRSDSGVIVLDGHRIESAPAHVVSRYGLARTFQIPRPFPTLSVLDNVKVACRFGRSGGVGRGAQGEAMRYLEFAGLASVASGPVSALNLHQRKFLELARALACRPKVLLLDEVLAGLNPTEVDVAIDAIRRIRDSGISIVLVEHIMRAVVSVCDRVTVLAAGQMIAEGAPDDCLRDEAVITAYLGRRHAGGR